MCAKLSISKYFSASSHYGKGKQAFGAAGTWVAFALRNFLCNNWDWRAGLDSRVHNGSFRKAKKRGHGWASLSANRTQPLLLIAMEDGWFRCAAESDFPPFTITLRVGKRLHLMRLYRWWCLVQGSERFLGITGWDPSVCKPNRLHVPIRRFSFIILWYILYIPLKWSVIFLQSWRTSTGYFSNSTGSFVTKLAAGSPGSLFPTVSY